MNPPTIRKALLLILTSSILLATSASGQPICSVEPAELNFCTVRIGGGGEELPLTITNDGDSPLLGYVRDDPPYFLFRDHSHNYAYSLDPGESKTIWVVFDPPDYQRRSGEIYFDYSECGVVPCHGQGQEYPDPGGPQCGIYSPDWVGKPVQVGSTDSETVTVYNFDGGILTGTMVDMCGPFSVDFPCDFEITRSAHWKAWFTPTVAGIHTCTVSVSDDCDDLVFIGMAYNDYPSCQVDADTLDFGLVQVGSTGYQPFHIMNSGNEDMFVNMQPCGDFFPVQSGNYYIPYATQDRFVVGFTPTTPGPQECILDTGNGLCSDLVLIGTGIEPGGSNDLIGLYFDETGLQTSYTTTVPNEVVTAYLLVVNPSIPYGVGGWECCVEAEGGVVSMWWDLAGENINVATPPCFAVGMSGGPLTGSDVITLATLQFNQSDPGVQTNFYIHPAEIPSIPDVPVYVHGADPGTLLPLGWSSGAAELPVAKVNPPLSDETAPARATRLLANYPNPFNPSTSIAFELAKNSQVSLAVYDLSGRQIRSLVDGHLPPGDYRREWDGLDDRGRSVSSGVYCYQLVAEEYRATRRMVLLR